MRCFGINKNLHRCNRIVDGHLFCYDHHLQPIVWIFIVVFTVIAGSASIYSAIYDKGTHKLADVSLRFVYPKSPALILVNHSSVIAQNIKWAVILWNMDLPDRNDPLRIPVSTFDWLKSHNEGGPENLFDGPQVAPLLKHGDRLFGVASLDCPECERGRTYIVYIVWGESGWYSEIQTEKSGRILVPSNFLRESRLKYFNTLEAMAPAQSRMPIGE